jgi:hypothetical protein
LIACTAGTVDVGAIDDLQTIAAICAEHNIWMHVDGAYGALGVLSPIVRPLLDGIHLSDSIAFDFHKWGQVRGQHIHTASPLPPPLCSPCSNEVLIGAIRCRNDPREGWITLEESLFVTSFISLETLVRHDEWRLLAL